MSDKRLSFHFDASCRECSYTIFAAEPMVIRDGKRLHLECAKITSLDDFLKLEKYSGKDNPDRDARLAV